MFANSRKLLVPLATMAVAGIVTVGSGADWSSDSTVTSEVSGGELVTTNGQGGATLSIADLNPGDSKSGSLTITNDGTVAVTFALTETVAPPAVGAHGFFETSPVLPATDGVNDLQLVIERDGDEVYSGDFDELGSVDLTDLTNGAEAPLAAEADPLATPAVADSTVFTFTVTLSSQADTASQNAAAVADFQFVSNAVTDGQSVINLPWTS